MTTTTPARNTPTDRAPTATRRTLGAYLVGLVATTAGLVITAVDQVALGGLDRRLHAVYDPVGVSAAPAPLYAYLYVLGGLGVISWCFALGLARRGARSARKWSIALLVLGGLAVGPLFAQEYGQALIPPQFSVLPALAWLIGLAGVLTFRRPGPDARA